MKLLLDQGLPQSTIALLRAAGIDAEHVGEIGMATSDDAAILAHARRGKRIVVTLDADFHALLALAGASSPSVIRIRAEGLRAAEHAALIRRILDDCGADLGSGAAVTTDGRADEAAPPRLTSSASWLRAGPQLGQTLPVPPGQAVPPDFAHIRQPPPVCLQLLSLQPLPEAICGLQVPPAA